MLLISKPQKALQATQDGHMWLACCVLETPGSKFAWNLITASGQHVRHANIHIYVEALIENGIKCALYETCASTNFRGS